MYWVDAMLAAWDEGQHEAVSLLQARQVWLLPVVNPDAYAYNAETHPNGGGMARKNRRTGCGSRDDMGVDLNRNYGFNFDVDNRGSSPSTCAEDYRGPSAFSEPETAAVRDFIRARKDLGSPFGTALNFHSFGRLVNIPFSSQRADPVPALDQSIFNTLADNMVAVTGLGYESGHAWDQLYTVNGEASDWMYDAEGIFAFSPEVGPEYDAPERIGFWPRANSVASLGVENNAMMTYIAWAAGSRLVATGTGSVGASGLNLRVSNAGTRPVSTTQVRVAWTCVLTAAEWGSGSLGLRLRGGSARRLDAAAGGCVLPPKNISQSAVNEATVGLLAANDLQAMHHVDVALEKPAGCDGIGAAGTTSHVVLVEDAGCTIVQVVGKEAQADSQWLPASCPVCATLAATLVPRADSATGDDPSATGSDGGSSNGGATSGSTGSVGDDASASVASGSAASHSGTGDGASSAGSHVGSRGSTGGDGSGAGSLAQSTGGCPSGVRCPPVDGMVTGDSTSGASTEADAFSASVATAVCALAVVITVVAIWWRRRLAATQPPRGRGARSGEHEMRRLRDASVGATSGDSDDDQLSEGV